MQAITLLYHDVVPENHPEASGFLTPGSNRYKLTEASFRKHLEAIAKVCSQTPAGVSDAMNHHDGRIPLLVTFDDGGKSAYRPTADLLEERGWIGHFFITTDFIGAPGFVNAAEIRELRRRGHVIGSHSCSHPPRMSACLPEQIHDEWQRSTTVLGEILGEPVTVASIPAGYYSQQVARAADDCGIQALFSSEPQRQSWKVGNCTVFGRYCAFDRTPPARVAAVVRGELSARLLEYAAWNAKKIVKKTSGGAWLKFRATVLGSGR